MTEHSHDNTILRWDDISWEKGIIIVRKFRPDRNEIPEDTRLLQEEKHFSEDEEHLRITSYPGEGKVTDSGYDNFICCYAALPADRAVAFRADISVLKAPDMDKLNGQESFGLFLRDTMDKEPATGYYYSNMAAAGVWNGRYDMFGRDGITETDHGHIRNIRGYGKSSSPDSDEHTPLHIELKKKGSLVSASIRSGSKEILTHKETRTELQPDCFRCRDANYVYAGFLAARGFEIEIIKDTIEICIGQKTEQPAEDMRPVSGAEADDFRDIDEIKAAHMDNSVSTGLIWASPDGRPDGDGSNEDPYDLDTAIAACREGEEIRLLPGRYYPADTIILGAGSEEKRGLRRTLAGEEHEGNRPVLDFGDTTNSLRLTGDCWDVKDIDVTRGHGICIEGSYNRILGCTSYRNNEAGLLIRHSDNGSPRSEWPSYNLIEDCASFENSDPSGQHADGFACKVAAGAGNVFRRCKAYMNADDGFDLFAKNRPTGAVVIENCESYKNGYLRSADGSLTESPGNGNGFKLGGSGEKVEHVVLGSSAWSNRGYGFTNNSNPSLILKGCKGRDNREGNLNFYTYSGEIAVNKIIENCDFGGKRKVMIDVKGIEKEYRIGQIGHGTLQRDIQSWWARRNNREDPNIQIGREQRLTGDILHALNGVDLTVYQGERLGIIGGNGAGKSTLLKLISRVAAPTRGSIDLYGRITSMLEVGTGFHGEMTGRENIYLNGTILGMSKSEIDSKLDEIITFSEIGDYIDTPVKRYSSGMYVRLAFSVAAHLDSEIVIMDEVLAVGDVAFQKKCMRKMRQAAEDESRTILYVSHNMNTVRELCDRCIVLAEGKIVFDGDVDDAISCYIKYLQSSADEEKNLLLRKRRDSSITGICRIAGLNVPEDTVKAHEELKFEIVFSSTEDRSDVCIRLIVCNSAGVIIGMAYSDPVEIEKGTTTINYSFPPGNLAPGEYICDIAVFEFRNEIELKHDFLSKVLSFQIQEEETLFGRSWKARAWGNVKLERIRAEEL